MATDKSDRPSTPRAEYVAMAPDIALIRDLLTGTRRMHDQYKVYITKYDAEKPKSYEKRAKIAKVYGGLGRTLSASVGMLFAKEPEMLNFSGELAELWENVDGKGTHGKVAAKRKSEDAIADGFTAILVDHTPAPAGVVVHGGNEKALNLRPIWSSYQRADILSWRTAVINNVETLVQVVLRQGAADNVGKYGTKAKILYRVCTLTAGIDPENAQLGAVHMATWEILEEVQEGTGDIQIVSRGTGTFRDKFGIAFERIPLAICYAGRTDGILDAHPPLLDVAWANLEHWRVATNLRYYEDLCCFPQPTVEGELAQDANGIVPPFQLGPGVRVHVTAGSKFYWTEVKGDSITALRNSLAEKKDEMAELGASFLAKKTRGVETAEAKRLDAAAENSTLATSGQGVEDGLNEALRLTAQYMGIPAAQAPTIVINKDFDTGALDAPTMVAYVQAVVQAGIPARILLEAWQAGGRISPEEDLDALEAEIMANAAAIADQQAQAAKDLIAAKQQPPIAA